MKVCYNPIMSNTPIIMNPSQYTHFLAKLQTAKIGLLETHEKMSEEGACDEVLEAVTRAFAAVADAGKAIEVAREARKASLEAERLAAKQAREVAEATRKAEAQARKAAKEAERDAKASTKGAAPPAITQDTVQSVEG